MMNNNYYCVIMAGGCGSRLWPVSRNSYPKQFIEVTGTGKTFIRTTYDRFAKIIPQENIIVVTTSRYKDLVKKYLPELEDRNLLLEPYGRNTAPCIAYATYTLLKRNPDAAMIVTPVDHIIYDEDVFDKTAIDALDYACKHKVLMTIGILPTRPDNNYGYIQVTGGRNACMSKEAVKVKTFTEKPDKELAKVFIDSGEFFWNSGIFAWTAETIKEELEKHLPEITHLFHGWEKAIATPAEEEFITRAYTGCINISIDYGVMEKTDRAWLYPADFGWSDIGAWESLQNFFPRKDANGNAVLASKTLSDDSRNNLVISQKDGKLIAVKGLEDYLVIDTDDVLLICPKDDKNFKDITSSLALPGYEKYR